MRAPVLSPACPSSWNCPLRYANNETALSVASTLASKMPWLVTTAAISREGRPGLIVIGGSKLPGSFASALSKEDVARAVDDGDVGHAVAGEVGHDGRVPRNQADRAGRGELPVPLVELDRDAVGALRDRWRGRVRRRR